MAHGPAVKLGKDKASEAKSKLGVKMFFVYLVVYVGFVSITTIDSTILEKPMFAGLNLAVVYGFTLIILAIIMGIVYNQMATNLENKLNKPE